MVDRPRVRKALDADGDARVILVAAPAGYGKTTAVRAWCAGLDAGLAWVTVNAGDNDPLQLWRYVATAVDRVRPGLGRGALQRLNAPGGGLQGAVDELMNGIAALGRRFVLVLDDLHELDNEECMSSIDNALAHLSPNATVILVTRVDPMLGLARLRASGTLTEVRANDLSFTSEEAAQLLLTGHQLELGRQEIEALVERTEGWPAALVLAGLWLQTVDDVETAVRTFGGDHRFVADYLSNEVLASLDGDRREFLGGAAVLGEFTAELCDHVLDRVDSAAQLTELEHANLFVLRLERGGWFRIHPLFAEYARSQLARADPTAETTMHRKAALWLGARGMPLEAIGHAAAAGDHESVTQLLLEYHVPLIRQGASRTLLRWIRTLPDDRLVKQPELAVAAAIAAMLDGSGTLEQRRYLRISDRARAGHADGSDSYVEMWALVARALTVANGVREAVLEGRRAVGLARGIGDGIASSLAALARALFFAGEMVEASDVALEALEQPGIDRQHPSLALARTTLALVSVEQGRLAAARTHAQHARAAVSGIGSGRSWLGANASTALGAVLAAEGNLSEAEHLLTSAEHLIGDEVPTLHQVLAQVLLARVRVERGHLEEAENALRLAREALAELHDSGWIPVRVDEIELELEAARTRARSGELLEKPSEAELAVLRLLVSDRSIREIAEHLFLSPNTIRTHRRALYRKLGVSSRTDALSRATELGLLDEPSDIH